MDLDAEAGAVLRASVSALLAAHWDDERGYCRPNPATYPHLWLWDSCFHAVVWAHLGDDRATRELGAVLDGQLVNGLVPHMRYGGQPPDAWLGPLPTTSSLAHPPMFGHAIKTLTAMGFSLPPEVLDRAKLGLEWLWSYRRTELGLIYVVHPWEAGNDHSPRWDGWGAPGRTRADYDRAARTAWNKQLMNAVSFHGDGSAAWSRAFVACPAGFNAYVAFNLAELAEVLGDAEMADRGSQLAAAMDQHLWDPGEELWADLPVVGARRMPATTPITDGVMGALVTGDVERASAALTQLDDPGRFAAPFGPANVARSHPSYDPAMYWRGAAWPHLNYLLWLALRRWDRHDAAAVLARRTRDVAVRSGWAEYWDPETGQGLGAVPQSWTGLALAMTPDR